MFEWIDRLVAAIAQRKPWAVVLLVLIAVVPIGAFLAYVTPGVIVANATKRATEYATSASLFLDCQGDVRLSKTAGQYGDLPKRVIFLERYAPVELQMSDLPAHDNDSNIIEIHNTFKRCTLDNNGSVDLHNIKIAWRFHGYGPMQNLVANYPYELNVSDLAPNAHVTFGITSATMLAFYVLPPTSATAQTTLDTSDKPVQLGESDYTRNRMVYDPLMPTQLRKTSWRLSPCHWQGAIVMHNGRATINLPKSCAGAPWITAPVNP